MDSEKVKPWTIGDTREYTVKVTDDTVRKFADLSGDYNPIHVDEEFAKTTRFGRRIAHGMISGALISRVLAEQLGAGGIYLSQYIKFTNPVFIDDSITVVLKVLSIREGKGIATIETNCLNQHGEFVAKGEAVIMMPEYVKSKPL
jgi:acyl dehydratase